MGGTHSILQEKTEAAGCFFSNEKHVLGGLQKKKGKWILSGFGGKCKKDEIFSLTAFRECLEELLGLFDVSPSLLHDLYLKHRPSQVLVQSSYTNYVYSFTQLESILQMIFHSGITTCPLYSEFPLTVQDLVFKRIINQTSTCVTHPIEVTVLALVPAKPFTICEEFQWDIKKVFQTSV
jgi:hypothetical protein